MIIADLFEQLRGHCTSKCPEASHSAVACAKIEMCRVGQRRTANSSQFMILNNRVMSCFGIAPTLASGTPFGAFSGSAMVPLLTERSFDYVLFLPTRSTDLQRAVSLERSGLLGSGQVDRTAQISRGLVSTKAALQQGVLAQPALGFFFCSECRTVGSRGIAK